LFGALTKGGTVKISVGKDPDSGEERLVFSFVAPKRRATAKGKKGGEGSAPDEKGAPKVPLLTN
ncbi:MAG TPA: hypothetical protein DIT40_14125, partial [Alphaproteobacteria bacterium]|nr:hypothetical protein [Alphaproteobacteria bacterium]